MYIFVPQPNIFKNVLFIWINQNNTVDHQAQEKGNINNKRVHTMCFAEIQWMFLDKTPQETFKLIPECQNIQIQINTLQ